MSKMPTAQNDFYKHNSLPREAHLVMNDEPSMTRQEFAAECDINTIMKQYDKYLSDPMMSLRQQQGWYIPEILPDTLMENMQILKDGEEAFYRLPASVRKEFDNDPVLFVDYAMNPKNLEHMRELGLAPPAPKPPEPMMVKIIEDDPKPPQPPLPAA